jgi:hypothetical protein
MCCVCPWSSEITPEVIHDDTVWVQWETSPVSLRVNKPLADNKLLIVK